MKGKILGFDQTNNTGVVSGEDGNRYSFNIAEWKTDHTPQPGLDVDFVPNSDIAKEVYPMSGSSDNSPTRIGAALFAFFLGAFGAHKFYLGYKKQGSIMLLISCFGVFFGGFPSLIMILISLVEAILYFSKSDSEFQRVYVLNTKPWF